MITHFEGPSKTFFRCVIRYAWKHKLSGPTFQFLYCDLAIAGWGGAAPHAILIKFTTGARNFRTVERKIIQPPSILVFVAKCTSMDSIPTKISHIHRLKSLLKCILDVILAYFNTTSSLIIYRTIKIVQPFTTIAINTLWNTTLLQ